jgi:hypothetical protein
LFDAAELGDAVAKSDLEAREPTLRIELINAHYEVRDAAFRVVGSSRGIGVSRTSKPCARASVMTVSRVIPCRIAFTIVGV